MKTFLAKVLLLGCFLGGLFVAGRHWTEMRSARNFRETTECNWGFCPAAYPLEMRPFVICICGSNNGAFVEKTLGSVFAQTYGRYRIIYIDDASVDGSFELAQDYIYARISPEDVVCIRNEERMGMIYNLVRAVNLCQDDEIVVVLGAEDWFAHEWVLEHLNRYYADPDLWITFGQYCEFPSYRIGTSRSYTLAEADNLRQAPFLAGYCKSFYASLFKRLPSDVFRDSETAFDESAGLAYMLPMLEMGQGHFQFIPEVCYISNRRARVQEDKELQARQERLIRAADPLAPLEAVR